MLFKPITGGGLVVLIDIEGKVHHTWQMPYPPGLYGYLAERGTLFYNGNIPNDSYIGQRAFQGRVAMEVDWHDYVRWEVRCADHITTGGCCATATSHCSARASFRGTSRHM